MQINTQQSSGRSPRKGFSLIETVMYVTLLSLLTVAAVVGLMQINVALEKLVLSRLVDDAAQEVMEKVVREIRFASKVNMAESHLSVNPSTLVLDSTDTSGTAMKVEFSLNGSVLQLKRNGVLSGPLTPAKVQINELIFDHIVTPESEAVKVSLVLTAQGSGIEVEEPFNTTVVLRASY